MDRKMRQRILLRIYILTLVVVILIVPKCFWIISKDVDCKSKLFLTIINNSVDTFYVKLVDKHNDKQISHIFIENDSFYLSPHTNITGIINYSWTGNQDCFFAPEFYESRYKTVAELRKSNSVFPEKEIFPWDTTDSYLKICSCSTYVYRDTITIP